MFSVNPLKLDIYGSPQYGTIEGYYVEVLYVSEDIFKNKISRCYGILRIFCYRKGIKGTGERDFWAFFACMDEYTRRPECESLLVLKFL
jgi:hypothetical protein